MKKGTLNKGFFSFMILLISVFSLVSCEDEFATESIDSAKEPPVVTSVSEAREDIPVTQGVLENTYIIRGKNLASLTEIYFNGVQAGFNPALTTDELTFVTIPENAPYVGQNNKMTLVNLYGTTEYDFSLLTIEEYTEATVDGVKTVTLHGGDFSETTKVTFVSGSEENGNLVEREAEILSVSETEVTVAVPSGVEQAYIYLETSRGAVAQSESYGFSYSIFIDALNPDWEMSQWGGTFDAQNTDPALGEYSIKSVREGWSGITFLAPDIPFDQYEAITVSLYGTGAPGDSVTLAINDFDGNATHQQIELIPGEWKKVVIPLSNFYPNGGEPNTIFRLDFQESSNTGKAQYIFYIDDFGFL
ncbi:hypothetical protein C7S20_04570 [Christiangramia fulva]|uniref:IPT/TIG domain-containing protein n=1 Tax=Christiangramia fulva TaxID=2126553 RepID=A0A2R3Z2W6_9FLAO|nr:hypothetical protein [Christiangramia fulva]AVR44596.1 hypothetical protein C7S20_04570 [Christiangramia fulva]